MQRKTISSHLPRKHSIIAGLYDDRLTYSTFEGELIDSAPVQRLRNIFQQWVSSYIYPDTSHTRFSHSLGVMYLATRMLQNAINNSDLTLSAEEKERAFLYTRIGALFHDTGHPPMSHALESHLPNKLTHEDYTMRMLVETAVPNIIQSYTGNNGISAAGIAQIFNDSEAMPLDLYFVRQLLHSLFDSDRLDYLLRDSKTSGVSFGQFDFNQLTNSLVLVRNEHTLQIALNYKGISSLADMLDSRIMMFEKVYLHKKKRILEWHLREFVKGAYTQTLPENIDDYLQLNDYTIINLLQKYPNNIHTQAFLNHQHFRCIYETPTLPTPEELAKAKHIEQAILNETGLLENVDFYVDTINEAAVKEKNLKTVPILTRDGSIISLAEAPESRLISRLQPFQAIRIYVAPQQRDYYQQLIQKIVAGYTPQ